MEHNKKISIGSFKVVPLDVPHDVKCFAYLINHKETGLCLFLTDCLYNPYKISGLNNVIHEANYDEEILNKNVENGSLDKIVKDRVIRSHTSFDTLKKTLTENDISKVNNIVLIHLSQGNADANKFKKEITELTGKNIFIAKKDMEIQFNKTAF